jgi:DNA-directed RNA polymerase subunit K/omega
MSDSEHYLSDSNSDSDSESENSFIGNENKKLKIAKPIDKKGTIQISAYDSEDEEEQEEEEEEEEEKKGLEDVDEIINVNEENSDIDIESDSDSDSDNDDESYGDIEEYEKTDATPMNKKKSKQKQQQQVPLIDSDDDEDDDENENYLQKFDNDINNSYIFENHPECLIHNYDEISKLSVVVRDSNNIIIDPLHKTCPFLTKYEKTKILGQRAKQIENNAIPFVKVPENIVDSYIIAELELQEKRIPFIIRRPIPGGAFEYWNLKDLEIISF